MSKGIEVVKSNPTEQRREKRIASIDNPPCEQIYVMFYLLENLKIATLSLDSSSVPNGNFHNSIFILH